MYLEVGKVIEITLLLVPQIIKRRKGSYGCSFLVYIFFNVLKSLSLKVGEGVIEIAVLHMVRYKNWENCKTKLDICHKEFIKSTQVVKLIEINSESRNKLTIIPVLLTYILSSLRFLHREFTV